MIHYWNPYSHSCESMSRFIFHNPHYDVFYRNHDRRYNDIAPSKSDFRKYPSVEEVDQEIIEETKECFQAEDEMQLTRTKLSMVLKAFKELNAIKYRDLLEECIAKDIQLRGNAAVKKDLDNADIEFFPSANTQ